MKKIIFLLLLQFILILVIVSIFSLKSFDNLNNILSCLKEGKAFDDTMTIKRCIKFCDKNEKYSIPNHKGYVTDTIYFSPCRCIKPWKVTTTETGTTYTCN